MPVLKRTTSPRGARFYDDGGKLMFIHVLDGSTQFGPREATEDDMGAHPAEFAAYTERADESPIKPLVTFTDPEGGAPPKEVGPYAARRARVEK